MNRHIYLNVIGNVLKMHDWYCPIDVQEGFKDIDCIQETKSNRKLTFIAPKKPRPLNSSYSLMNRHITGYNSGCPVDVHLVLEIKILSRESNNSKQLQLTFITQKTQT